MTVPSQSSQAPAQETATQSSKELNFRQLEAKFKRELEQEKQARLDLERRYEESRRPHQQSEDDESDEPYVDHKKLSKKLAVHEQQTMQKTHSEIKNAIAQAKEEAKAESFLENNSDFYDVLNNHAEKLANKSPALAKSILAMPESFERQKLVYQTIKELGLHKDPAKEPSIQEKIDANRRSPFYQPTGVGSAPYHSQGDFSQGGQKQAYDKMQELKNRLRI